jgi:hypothetical protein
MDLVKILDAAMVRLPEGEHTQGLKAIKRHIAAAIRHFDREDSGDLDSFTDAIYRTNQAFEGGLKEAYRVLTGKDPAKLTPFQIETYLEENKLIRPRALKQLTRYREDYRNPSVHDYKLDFDADEALLAIVSVCAFSKLLVNQIAGKLAYRAGSSIPAAATSEQFGSIDEFARSVCDILTSALGQLPDKDDIESDQVNGFIDGVLTRNGIKTSPVFENDGESDEYPWDNIASKEAFELPIECRVVQTCSLSRSVEYIHETLNHIGRERAVLVLVDRQSDNPFEIYYKTGSGDSKIYVITQRLGKQFLKSEDGQTMKQFVPAGR